MADKPDVLERLDGVVWEKDVTALLAECAAEIRRLRAALAVVADPGMWGNSTSWIGNKQVPPFIWAGTGEFADPMVWAKKEAGR